MPTNNDEKPHESHWWRSLAEHADPAAARAAAADEIPNGAPEEPLVQLRTPGSRRDFFKIMGLSAAAATAACRRAPVQQIFPYTWKPEGVTPGLAQWYATACGGCAARCGLLVKTRDGRPIKIEGNPTHPVSRGAVCAVGQASVLGLYDADRAQGPRLGGGAASWAAVDAAVAAALDQAAHDRKGVRVVIPWGLGPTDEAAVDAFLARHDARAVRFDPMGVRDAIAAAHDALYGVRLCPDYHIDAADLVVSFDADFLGAYLGPAPLTRQWSVRRAPLAGQMLRHVQIESNMTVTGGAADERIALPPSSMRAALAALVGALADTGKGDARAVAAARASLAALGPGQAPSDLGARFAPLGAALAAAGPRGLVLSGSDDPALQLLAAVANALLGNTGATVGLDAALATRAAELSIHELAREAAAGELGVVIFAGTNPALVDPALAAALPRVPFTVSTSDRLDETATLATAHAPEGHALEAWSDHRPRTGVDTMAQPCVSPLFDTRARTTSLLAWAGNRSDGYAFLEQRWSRELGSVAAWDAVVRDGVWARDAGARTPALASSFERVAALARAPGTRAASGGALELVLVASVALHDGTGPTPNNGWLQELPDPITKAAWGNCAALAPVTAQVLGVGDGDLVRLETDAGSIALPALRQPGLAPGVVAVAVGHGRARAGRVASGHGVDAWRLAPAAAHGLQRAGASVRLTRAGGNEPLVLLQTHASQEGRRLVRQVDLDEVLANPRAGNEPEAPEQGHRGLWPGHEYDGHRWGLAVDLNKCTGCGACVVSCSSENNVPIVGAVEAGRRREMHWLRIDRYYGGTPDAPEVLHQPMMCQHCENAPCETVCPVAATVHSSEGLNQQVYNRCVGTRYCANNCPTKVRRFNWFEYDRGTPLERMVLNPDVVVRSRGVMEKCSLCVHRIEEARALSRREGRDLADGDIQTACQQSCPAEALVFGDSNDRGSALSRLIADGRAYRILDEIHVLPQVTYLSRVKNRGPAGAGGRGKQGGSDEG